MELRQLRYFVTVVEEGSFTAAAAKLYVAQSGVSAQIRSLERELGQPLLDRSGRTVRLTDVGHAVLPDAQAALDAAGRIQLAVDEHTGLTRGHVNVGTVAAIASIDLVGVLASFARRHPAVEITLTEETAAHLVAELGTGRLDMILVGTAVALPAGIATQTVADEELLVAVAPDDPLAGRRSLSIRALRDRRLICLPRGSGLRAWLDQACAAAGVQPQVTLEATDPQMLTRLAAHGMGVAVLPRSAAQAHGTDLATIPIAGRHQHIQLRLAWSTTTTTSPAARALLHHARTHLPDLPVAAGR